MKKILLVFLLCVCTVFTGYAASDATRRFGVFVGSNNGGRNRTTLRYAVSDARAVFRVFTEMGGINAADSVLLVEPDVRELDRQISALKERVRAEVTLVKDRRTMIGPADFSVIAAPSSAARGDLEAEDAPVQPFNIQLIPNINLLGFDHGATNHVFIGLLVGIGHNLRGVGVGGLGLSNTGFVHGARFSGIFNTVSRDMTGLEAAGIFNFVREDVRGAQIAGIFNITEGSGVGLQASGIFNLTRGSFSGLQTGLVNYSGGNDSSGVRIGLVNVSESENVFPVGLVNVIKNGLMHPAIWYDDLGFINLSLKSGSKYFYSILGLGVHNDLIFENKRMLITRTGIGAELPLNKFFLNFDVTSGQIMLNYSWDENSAFALIAQARLSAGYKLYKHLGVFAGISYDYILSPRDGSLEPGRDFGFSALGWNNGRHTHKVGFFGGIQF
jgi:hypothetical protein